jgi:putative mycofactocin binding protein MftB
LPSTASAGCTNMAAAGIRLHPACRVRQEGFGLLFYDSRGPRLLFAATGTLLPADFFGSVRHRDELPAGVSEQQKKALEKFVSQLLEKGFLREQ